MVGNIYLSMLRTRKKEGGPRQRHNAPLSCTSEIAAHLRIYTFLRASNTMSRIKKHVVPPSSRLFLRGDNFKSLKGSPTIPHSVHLPCRTHFLVLASTKICGGGGVGKKGCQFGLVLCLSWRRWRWYVGACVHVCWGVIISEVAPPSVRRVCRVLVFSSPPNVVREAAVVHLRTKGH